jgi:transposase InsO family protein
MLDIILMIPNFLILFFRLLLPGGARKIAAENLTLRKELMTLSRGMKRSPKLTTSDRIFFGMLASMISPIRLSKIAIILKPATILKFHQALVKRKYRLLFSNKNPKKPGRKGPGKLVVDAIVEMKSRNPSYGYRRIAMQISIAFDVNLDKDIVRRVLNKHYKFPPDGGGPSWLTFIGNMKDSLWSIDFFRAESINLNSHWIMVVMDLFSRRIIGFSVHKGALSGVDICCMFNKVLSGKMPPNYLSSDNEPLFKFYRWQANLRILDIEEIKSVPYTPTSHPFIERLIGTCRRELLDKTLFWNERDLQNKLEAFQQYYNDNRGHESIDGNSPNYVSMETPKKVVTLNNYRWKKECRGLYQLPIAA